ncbi:MAG: hypothetical protein ACON34_07725 [Flavobacteriales bacterium]
MKNATPNLPVVKRKRFGLALVLTLVGLASMQSCIIITDGGNHGQEGRAYFGIDYDWNPPYSYWDNNPSVPDNPFFGEYYRTLDGIYDFEYFINPYEYWWGTYEIYVNPGTAGGPNGEDGLDGADTYLMLICNDNGFYFEGWEDCSCTRTLEDGTQIIELDKGDKKYRIEMRKADVRTRPSENIPKFRADQP